MYISGSISVGRVAYKHDTRQTRTKNVDPNLTKYNVELVNKLAKYDGDIEAFVNKRMQPVIDRYNEGKKPSRKIKEKYTDYRAHNKNLAGSPLSYEAVIQLGDKDTLGGSFYREFQAAIKAGDTDKVKSMKDKYTEAYSGVLEAMRTKYTHVEVVGAWIHFDEPGGTPHMHVNYVPFGDQQKGLSKQVSIGRALACDGIERVQSRAEAKELGGYQMTKWFNQIHEGIIQPALSKFMKNFPSIEWKRKEVQHGKQHLDVDTFKAVKSAENRLEKLLAKEYEAQSNLEAISEKNAHVLCKASKKRAEIAGTEDFKVAFNLNIASLVNDILPAEQMQDIKEFALAQTEEQFGLDELQELSNHEDLDIELGD